jgi:hypothetical protein
VDAQRQAFLNGIVGELAAPSRRRRGVKRAVAGAILATGSFLALSATAAHAAPPPRATGTVMAGDCYTPDFVPWDHTKTCDNPWTFVSYDYQYTYSPNGSNVYCHVFDASWFGCGGYNHIGTRTRCGYV